MSASMLRALGAAVSVVAVTLSLLDLAFRVRQQTRTLRSQNFAHALGRLAAVQARSSGDAAMANLFARGARNPSALTVKERIQFAWTFYGIFGAFEFMHDQSRGGALPRSVWDRWEATLAWWLQLPGVVAWWRARPTPFNADFTALVDAHLRAPRVDHEVARRWRAFAANSHTQPADPS